MTEPVEFRRDPPLRPIAPPAELPPPPPDDPAGPAGPTQEIAEAAAAVANLAREAEREAHSLIARAKARHNHDMTVWSADEGLIVRKVAELIRMVKPQA